MPNGAMARPAKFVKAMQIIREQKIELEMKRRVASDAEALAFKEERRARELDEALLESRRQLAVQKAKMDASPLGYHAQPAEENQFLKRLQTAVEFGEAQCRSQHATSQRERAIYLHAERAVQELERVAVKNELVESNVADRARRDLDKRKVRADEVIHGERDAAEAMERRHARRVGLLKKETARAERLGNEQARAAEANNKGAVTRMMATTATTLRVLADINAQKAMDHAERVEQVLELKANTDAAVAKMRGANERSARRKAVLLAARGKEFADLEAKGENPYKVGAQLGPT